MLKGINPILTGDLLGALRDMGHGDEMVIVDANYPAFASDVPVVTMPGLSATVIAEAVLSLMPLDDFVDDPALVMDAPGERPGIYDEFEQIIAQHEKDLVTALPRSIQLTPIDRFAFYERASHAFVVVQSGERRLYGNIMFKKGVIRPEV